jgi:hypothetical protein
MAQESSVRVVDGGGPPPPSETARDATRSAARAAASASLVDELAGLDKGEEVPAPAPAPAEEEPDTTEEQTDPGTDEPADEDAEDEEEAERAEKAEEPAAKPDKDLDRRLSAVQRETMRAKAAIAAERAALVEERQAIEARLRPQMEELQQFKQLRARAKFDLPSVLEALGYEGDDFDHGARQVHLHWKAKVKGDATAGSAGARLLRDREQESELAATRRELAELRQTIEQQSHAQRTAAWLEETTKAASDETPRVAAMLERSPKRARMELAKVADRLLEETGEVPDHSDVVAELEKDLDELGLVAPATSAKAAPKPNPVPPAAKNKPAKTHSNDLRTSSVQPGSKPMSRDERRAADLNQLVADMQAGRIDA